MRGWTSCNDGTFSPRIPDVSVTQWLDLYHPSSLQGDIQVSNLVGLGPDITIARNPTCRYHYVNTVDDGWGKNKPLIYVKSCQIIFNQNLINGLPSRPSTNPWWNQKTSKGLKGNDGKCVLACHQSTLLCPVKPCSPAMLIVRQSLERSNHYLRNQHRSNSWTSFPPCLASISAEIGKQTSENNTAGILRTIT